MTDDGTLARLWTIDDVDRLLEVTRYVIRSLAVHLIPAHRA